MSESLKRFAEPVAAKVPEITVLFWVIKVLTTGMGEATSDALAAHNIALAAAVGLAGFLVAMWLQLSARRYRAGTYWFAVAMVAVFGTMAADGFHKVLHIPYYVTTAMYAVALAGIFVVWRRTEHTLSIHSITTRRRELFYWLAVLATFALGTAAGDLTAFTLHLGFADSVLLFAVAIALPGVAYWCRRLNGVAAFWTAYVLTRPLGASIADWLGKAKRLSGLGYGDAPVAIVAAVLIAVLVAALARTRTDVQSPRAASATLSR
jgi:uncharacterized membrane-anchored protein